MIQELDANQAKSIILDAIRVTSERVDDYRWIVLNALTQSPFGMSSSTLISEATKAAGRGASRPLRVFTHSSREPLLALNDVAAYLSEELASAEAILSLLHQGELVPMDAMTRMPVMRLLFSATPTGDSDEDVEIFLNETAIALPGTVRPAWSRGG
ncbi:MAG: hypothetical protein ACYC61_24240 [Isosphaeraceae bacterium]